MSTETKCEKARPDDLLEEQYNFDSPNNERFKRYFFKIAVMVILATGIALHAAALVTPHLVSLRTFLHTETISFEHLREASITYIDIDMGALKMCSEAWGYHCVNWGDSNVGDPFSDQATQLEAPGWLQTVQRTSISGLVIAAITDAIVIFHLIFSDVCRRLFPFLICLGSLIAGTLVLIGSALLAFNYKSISNHKALLAGLNGGLPGRQADFSFSIGWGFVMDAMAIGLMWISGLLMVLGCKGVNKTDDARKGDKLFMIFDKFFTHKYSNIS